MRCEVFAHRLREERLSRGLTQKALAMYICVTPNAITMYESGKREPSLDFLLKICDFFDVSADYLIGRADSY